MQKRLLFVVNVDWFFISHRLPIALAARTRNYQVHLAAAFEPGTRAYVESLGITTHQMSFSRSGSSLFELLRDLCSLIRLLREFRNDILHLVTIKPVLLGGFAARLLRMPNVVLAIPGRGSVFSSSGLLAAARRAFALLAYRFAYSAGRTTVILQNVEDRDYFVRRGVFRSADIKLIRGSGVDPELFMCVPETEYEMVVVFASRMLRQKGVSDFVGAARILKNQGLRARFVLVGEPDLGNPHSHTVEELRAWAAEGIVEWWGHCRDMAAVFAQCNLVCLPTYYGEGVPKVLIEAAASARAVVTTDMPGCRDVVRHGHNGLLVKPRDVEGLAHALAQLLRDPVLRATMGKRGRELVLTEFSSHIVVGQTLNIYEQFQ